MLWEEFPRDGKQHWKPQPTLPAAAVALQFLACSHSGSPWTRSLPLTEERKSSLDPLPACPLLLNKRSLHSSFAEEHHTLFVPSPHPWLQGLCQEQGSPANPAGEAGLRRPPSSTRLSLPQHFTIMLSRGSAEDRGASGAEGIPANALPTWGSNSQQELGWQRKIKPSRDSQSSSHKSRSAAAPRNWKMNTPLVKESQ